GMGFGMTHAPRVWMELLRALLLPWKRVQENICLQDYLDDLWVSGETQQEVQEALDSLLKYLEILGLTVNRKKSQLTAAQLATYLGLIWNLKDWTVSLPKEKRLSLLQYVDKTRRRKMILPKDIQRIQGSLMALLITTKQSRYQIRPLQIFLRGKDMYKKTQNTMELHKALIWWSQVLQKEMSAEMIPSGTPQLHIQTDAADNGYGAVNTTDSLEFSGHWTEKDRAKRIEWKEMAASVMALLHWCKDRYNQVIWLETDNSIVQSYLNGVKGGRVTYLNKEMRPVWRLARKNNLTIKVTWIKSEENIRADWLSRLRINRMDYSLNMKTFLQLDQLLFKTRGVRITLDAFSTLESRRVQRFASRFGSPGATWQDTLSITKEQTKGEVLWMHPPWALIERTLRWWLQVRVECLLLVPLWPNYSWYQELLGLIKENKRNTSWILTPQQGLYEDYLGRPCTQPAWDTVCVYLQG
ncbi:MAG: hypothetical protein HRU27_20830, partial [Rhizobiaceae bacterium]|nr:hypothetical protein [Rhizobiaceae bacterium]